MVDLDQFTVTEIMARTIWGESRSEGLPGMVAVANVIMNRANNPKWWGNGVKDVCLKPYQFSCWNHNDPNFKLITDPLLRCNTYTTAIDIARLAEAGLLKDNTDGSNHYFATTMPHELIPDWSQGKTPRVVIGVHAFYKL